MGASLASVALAAGHEVVVISGPVNVDYPMGVTVIDVVSTEDMLAAAREQFADCDGLIGVAAPCDYRPVQVADEKIKKDGGPLVLRSVRPIQGLKQCGHGDKDL